MVMRSERWCCNCMQVCSTWRAVSRSELLWRRLTRRIWNRTRLIHDTWREEYIYRHRTASNFHVGRSSYTTLFFDPGDFAGDDNNHRLICRCLALSDYHLACGFADGTVRVFNLFTHLLIATYIPLPRVDRIGHLSAAVSGIIININDDASRLVFATQEGDIHVAIINNNAPARRSHSGTMVDDGILVDFSGSSRWWVGLYAGAQDRAFRIWNAVTEEIMYVGGTLTNDAALDGWHLLNELAQFVGRVRVTGQELAVACTRERLIVFELRNPEIELGEEEFQRRIMVGAMDANHDSFVVVDGRGRGSVRRAATLEEVCRFPVLQREQRGAEVMGCMNGGCALMCALGVIRVWELDNCRYLYTFAQRIDVANSFIADDRHVAACSSDNIIHLWDFGAQ